MCPYLSANYVSDCPPNMAQVSVWPDNLRSEDAPVMAVVILVDSSGEELRVKAEDAMLYERDINEGDKVYFDKDNKLEKAMDEDWTKNYTSNTVDTMAFVNMMQAVKSGESVDWKCPFCGGNIVLMKNEGGHTVIGCEECDMRINLESN